MKLLRSGNTRVLLFAMPNTSARVGRVIGYLFGSFVLLFACEGGSKLPADGSAMPAAPLDAAPGSSAQVPPMGQAALEAWLASGAYKQWRCENQIFPMRLNGAHGHHRICSNDLVYQEGTSYPVGAASVKELFDMMDRPYGYAVGVKVAAGSGASSWYWYERVGRLATLSPVADGIGVAACGPMCHAAAPRDNVFLKAP
jgi:hypothetical protein